MKTRIFLQILCVAFSSIMAQEIIDTRGIIDTTKKIIPVDTTHVTSLQATRINAGIDVTRSLVVSGCIIHISGSSMFLASEFFPMLPIHWVGIGMGAVGPLLPTIGASAIEDRLIEANVPYLRPQYMQSYVSGCGFWIVNIAANITRYFILTRTDYGSQTVPVLLTVLSAATWVGAEIFSIKTLISTFKFAEKTDKQMKEAKIISLNLVPQISPDGRIGIAMVGSFNKKHSSLHQEYIYDE